MQVIDLNTTSRLPALHRERDRTIALDVERNCVRFNCAKSVQGHMFLMEIELQNASSPPQTIYFFNLQKSFCAYFFSVLQFTKQPSRKLH